MDHRVLDRAKNICSAKYETDVGSALQVGRHPPFIVHSFDSSVKADTRLRSGHEVTNLREHLGEGGLDDGDDAD